MNGLTAALGLLAETTQRLSRQRCTLRCPRPVDLDDHQVAVQLYRIAQEAVNNATKHAPGCAIEIALLDDADRLELVVGNDVGDAPGRFNESAGIGLRIMRHRAEMIGAELVTGLVAGRWSVAVRVGRDSR